MSLLITPNACGYVDKRVWIFRTLDRSFPLFLGRNSVTHRVIHTCLWIADLAAGVLTLTLSSEGHPRGNGDGPLTTHRSQETKGG